MLGFNFSKNTNGSLLTCKIYHSIYQMYPKIRSPIAYLLLYTSNNPVGRNSVRRFILIGPHGGYFMCKREAYIGIHILYAECAVLVHTSKTLCMKYKCMNDLLQAIRIEKVKQKNQQQHQQQQLNRMLKIYVWKWIFGRFSTFYYLVLLSY